MKKFSVHLFWENVSALTREHSLKMLTIVHVDNCMKIALIKKFRKINVVFYYNNCMHNKKLFTNGVNKSSFEKTS
jgi:hypothetical protein